eukprot:TRINITY_DN216_c0_g6_i1.p1 TRINITY_DN216_c0_g6~~TRINITY_DN216_c0_g6_i1.p1  ORF type:complete len:710 (-),score=180.06 TRINITY_DN216_c0_g6_i1:63-2192(-)
MESAAPEQEKQPGEAPAAAETPGAEGAGAAPAAAVDEAAAREARIAAALARCEAPIKPEFLVAPAAPSAPNKRKQPEPDEEQAAAGDAANAAPAAAAADGADGAAAAAAAPEGGSEGAADGKGKGKGKGKKGKDDKRKRTGGQNKASDRVANTMAMKQVRESQVCQRFAYLNCCDNSSANGSQKAACKNSHDVEAALAAKLPNISEECPVLARLGVCPAGINCRFGGHIVNGKNVDRDGVELTPDSPWAKKVPGIGNPPGELNVFSYEDILTLRRKTHDFTPSEEVVKSWNRYRTNNCVGEPDAPIGSVVMADRRPLDLRGKTVLAPLTTVGNLPFRRLCVKLGCEVTVGEMAMARSILEGSPGELALLRRHESEKCYGIQVAGGDIEEMTKVAQFVEDRVDCDFVDINCGCPLDDVHKRGAGSRLMSSERKLEGIVRCMSSVLKTKHLTLKCRTAHFEDKKADDFADFQGRTAHKLMPQITDWGVSALTLHGRTARQRYTKLADWDYINVCSQRMNVHEAARPRTTPLIACGDVLTWEEAEEHRQKHGVDSIMVGRGALIKPWLFTEINERRHWDISASERFDLMRDFVHFGLDHWGSDGRGVETTRRFLLEWLSFSCRYIPVGVLEQMPMRINWRPRPYVGRSDLETRLGSQNSADWVSITEMLLGKVPQGFTFVPKHKSSAVEKTATGTINGEASNGGLDVSGASG